MHEGVLIMHYANLQVPNDGKDEKQAGKKVVTVQVTSTYRTVEGTSPYVITASRQQISQR
jgi:hypothetical protein